MVKMLWQATSSEESVIEKRDVSVGSRVGITSLAGPKLSGRIGHVVGHGYYPKSLRIVLDGSKSPITLHFTYVELLRQERP
ncbi:hypothetical protein [Bradyrhizobium sp. HKCCYLS20291]|uniref:hypothetical protein n=1 Tax=Bradyrhizobium sp. HKCCYLS20291 TaxID=3420766 RepID=UPI003EBBCCA0